MNVQRRSLATSSTDLRCLQHISTSTSDLTLTKDSETQTENGELDQREEDASSQTDTESTDSEVEEEDAAETGEMTDARADVGSGADTTPDVTGQSVSGATARPVIVAFNEPIDKVTIVQQQEITKNTFIAANVTFGWDPYFEERQAKLIKETQRKTKKQFKSLQHNIMREMKALLKGKAQEPSEEQKKREERLKEMEDSMKKLIDEQSKMRMESQERERRQEKEVKTFTFSLGEKHKRLLERVWAELDTSRLLKLVKRLYQKFKIRLREVGVYCGLHFVLDVPEEQAEVLAEQQASIQETILDEVLPEHFRQEVEWEPPVEVESAQTIPLPVQVSNTQEGVSRSADSTEQESDTPIQPQLMFDPMAAIPERSFKVETSDDGEKGCRITSLVVTMSGGLVLADFNNMSVKFTTVDQPARTHSLSLNVGPWDLAMFKDDVIAVTSGSVTIEQLGISDSGISIVKEIKTKRRYWCVASDGQGDTLVVSNVMNTDGPAVVDVITVDGKVLWTLSVDVNDPKIIRPLSLCLLGRDVLVSDKEGMVHRVDVVKGTRSHALTHSDLKSPGQVAADAAGNIYIACSHKEGCVLLYSTRGQWRKLLVGHEHGDGGRTTPQAVGITEKGIVVSWEQNWSDSVVTGFHL